VRRIVRSNLVIPLALLVAGAAFAQQSAPPCPAAADVSQADMLGTWSAQVDGEPAPLSLHLEKHPDFAGTLRGWLQRGTTRVLLAGDVGDGELTLEESANGRNISALWLGDVEEGSCGRVIRGQWQAEGAEAKRAFVLRKKP
jgi:hypothetical protein